MTVRNEATALAGAVPTPAAAVRSIASQSDISASSANDISFASVVSPMPRRGRFAIRMSETASYGLSITCRYETRSFTSARS